MLIDRIECIAYADLSHKKKENYNFHKVSAVLAEYGFNCIKLSDDWEGADFLAHHDLVTLKVQLKARTTISKKYLNKNLYIIFPLDDSNLKSDWCLIKHDLLVDIIREHTNWLNTSSWIKKGLYHSAKAPKEILPYLEKYIVNTKQSLNL